MNLLLLEDEDFAAEGEAVIGGRRALHLREVLNAMPGDKLRVGRLNGLMGQAEVLTVKEGQYRLRVALSEPPPPPLPVTLVLALPRPKMLRRILQAVTSLGVKQLVLCNSWRVEKSFWESPWLMPEAIREQLLLGLEQSRDTLLPKVICEPRFKPFVEDRLPALAGESRRLVAHPGGRQECPRGLSEAVTLVVGPEGGFIPYEISLLENHGFEAVHLGARILRVETAVVTLLSRLY